MQIAVLLTAIEIEDPLAEWVNSNALSRELIARQLAAI